MNKKNILFVCSLNWHRSKTAETLFSKFERFNVKSAGIKKYAETPITKELIDWSDTVFVMEEKHKTYITEKFIDSKKEDNIIILDIEDKYNYMDPKLIHILEEKIISHIK
jgi:predicted protein tyrosine phosphatase